MDLAEPIGVSRVLRWPDCRNVRDIGGLPAANGPTRDRVLVRADSLDRLTEVGLAAAQDYGVSTIVDLRSPWELPTAAHPFASLPGYRLLPFIDAERDHERDRASEQNLADLYRGSINRNGRRIAAAVSAIAEAPHGTIVVHCLAGADRTGMLIALILDALNVDRSAIVWDYDLTHSDAKPDDRAGPEHETMQQTLQHVDDCWGGSHSYLETHGARQSKSMRSPNEF